MDKKQLSYHYGFHPILKESSLVKVMYYRVLEYFVKKYSIEEDNSILDIIKSKFSLKEQKEVETNQLDIAEIGKLLKNKRIKKFRYHLLVDILFLLELDDKDKGLLIVNDYSSFFSKNEEKIFHNFYEFLYNLGDYEAASDLTLIKDTIYFLKNCRVLTISQLIVSLLKFGIGYVLIDFWIVGILYIILKSIKNKSKFLKTLLHSLKQFLKNIMLIMKMIKLIYIVSKKISYFEENDIKVDQIKVLFEKENLSIIYSWRINRRFIEQPLKKIAITATMSAGKSTLINALIGKEITRTSQEACTGNICYLYNKPFDDGYIVFEQDTTCKYIQDISELGNINFDHKIKITTNFRYVNNRLSRVCLIDTPGVNSALNKHHGEITRKFLLDGDYDQIIHILNGNKLGNDEETIHLEWVKENIGDKKIIFLVNKLDEFNSRRDNVDLSLNSMKEQLEEIGFENIEIYPVSAFCGLLMKKKAFGEILEEEDLDDYESLVRKFKKPMFDFSKYYSTNLSSNNLEENMLNRCGLLGLENKVFGGRV